MSPKLSRIGLTLLVVAAVTSRSWSATTTVNVKAFGAKGDCQHVMDGAMKQGSATLTSLTATFKNEDVGKPIYVLEAGAQLVPGIGVVRGGPLASTIVAVNDAHRVALADPAQNSVSAASVTWGTEDTQAIQKAIDSLNTTGGTVFFPAGMYRVTYQAGPGIKVRGSNIHLQGTGPTSAIFNSTVIFHAKIQGGITYTDQMGVPVLYVGSPSGINHVEVDHLWLGDNGQHFNYAIWGPGGPGVVGSSDQVDTLSLHDLTIVTNYLCGLNMDSRTNGFSIYNITVQSNGGNHGFYLAGYGSNGDIHDNRFTGTIPMRIGLTIKAKDHIRVYKNEITNAWFQGIGTSGDAAFLISTNVDITNNWIHDLTTPGTSGITIFNARNVTVTGNRIENVSWAGIYLFAVLWPVTSVTVKDNFISQVRMVTSGGAIVAKYVPPTASSLSPGLLRDIAIENNALNNCRAGIYVYNVAGTNSIRRNRIQSTDTTSKCDVGYNVDSLASSSTVFSDNVGPSCGSHHIGSHIISSNNTLK